MSGDDIRGSFDVAVVGLGAMGAATLYQLAKRGAQVIGIDRHVPPHAFGSSHGESRVTRQAVGEGVSYVPLVLRTHEIWRELERETGRPIFEACGMLILRRQGHACVHGQADFLGATARLANAHGIAHELLDANAIARRFSHFSGLDDTVGYYEPGGGYVVPEAAVAAQLQRAGGLGATLRTATAVTGIAAVGDGVEVSSPSGTVRARHAVVAAGGWIGSLLGPPFGRLLRVQRQVFHWYDVGDAYGSGEGHPVFIWLHGGDDTGHFYGFPPMPGTRQIKLATEHDGQIPSIEEVARTVGPGEGATLYEHHVDGRIRGVTPVPARSQVCFYTVTPDHGFIIDRHPVSERITVISACSGHGFKHSAAIGEAVAEQIAEGRSHVDLGPFGLARFQA